MSTTTTPALTAPSRWTVLIVKENGEAMTVGPFHRLAPAEQAADHARELVQAAGLTMTVTLTGLQYESSDPRANVNKCLAAFDPAIPALKPAAKKTAKKPAAKKPAKKAPAKKAA